MSQLPVVEGSTVITPAGGQPMNPEAFRQAALAPGKIAEAIGSGVGGLFEDLSNHLLEVRNTKAIFDADMAMRQTKDKFLTDIVKDPRLASDPATWTPEIQARTKDTQDRILNNPTLAPAVKRQLVQATGLWSMSTTSDVRTQALRRELADTGSAMEATAAYALNNSHPNDGGQGVATAIATYQKENQLGLIGPGVLAQKIKMAPIQATKAQLNSLMVDPKTASNAVELAKPYMAKLPPDDQKDMMGSLNRAQHEARNENYDDLVTSLLDPTTGQISATADAQQKVAQAVEAKQIDPLRGKNFIAGMKRENEAADTEVEKSVHAGAQNVSGWKDAKDADGGYEAYAADLRAQAALIKNPTKQQEALNEVNKQLGSMKKRAVLDITPEQSTMIERMNEDRLHRGTFIPLKMDEGSDKPTLVHSGVSLEELRGMDPKAVEKEFGAGVTKDDLLGTEQRRFDKKLSDMRDWFRSEAEAGRKPTPEQADTARQNIEYPEIQAAVVGSLIKQHPESANALRWIQGHPNDPRAAQIRKKLGY